jgi:hypothetical protein
MNAIDEFIHQTKLISQGQAGDYRPFVWGHVATCDPKLSRVRCIVPTLRSDSGVPILTPWMELGTLMVGNGWGIQYIPIGGASFTNPTAGEKVQIHVVERTNGVAVVATLAFSSLMLPPLPNGKPGDFIIRGPNGNSIYLQSTASGAKLQMNSTTEVDAGNIANAVVRLLREEAALSIYNNHTHAGGPVPDQQMTSAHLTAVLKAN